ncbi:MAG: condensation domain-containing protein [Azospirillaceae bacterium]|nr:condensation domain-containing protein [Azospirillaceae bacterium]
MNARLELLRRRLGQTGPARAGIPPRPDPDTAPLSAPQHRMWLHQQLYPASAAYNVCIRIDLAGDLDEDRLRAALAEIVNRHEVLRTTYPAGADGRPHQRIHRHLPPPVRIVESADPAQVARDAAAQPFDIATSGSIRFHLVRVGARQWSLVLTVHHIVWDGGCFGVFSHDLGLAYRGDGATPLAIQYADIAAHEAQHEAAASTDLDGQLDHWRRTLTPPPPALPLPSLRPFGPEVGERAERLDRTLPASGAKSLRAAAAALRTTPFVVFCAAYGLLLRRWTGETDITVGTMVANRHQPGTRELIGNFGNTALLRLDTSGDPTVRQLVARAAHTITGTLGNADIAFERVVADLAPAREPGHGFFTDTLCLFLDREIGGPDLPGVDVRWDNVPNGAAPFALTFQGFMNGDLLRVEATYRSELFAPATVNLMLEHLEAILLAATADPDQPCSTASQLPAGQRDHLARLSAGVATDRPAASVLGHWRRRAAATPDRTALVHGGRRFSYGEIDQGANRLAARLIERGMRAQDIVAVALARGPSTLTALLAIWKCGAVYLPLDPHHPKPRLIDLLSQADARLVIGDAALDLGGVPCLVAHQAGPVAIDPGHQPHALEAAHIGFTSGSTGGPKGVVTTHGSLAARTSWVAAHWPGGTGGARLAKSAPTAIDAVAELCEGHHHRRSPGAGDG